jgi:hypothetical protein
MTRDDEVIQKLEETTGTLLGKAQQLLTTALPGGPGAFVYVVMSNLVGKLFGNTQKYVESVINRPITLPDFIYSEPLDEELEVFFQSNRLKSIRSEFPTQYEDFSKDDWTKMRRYYMPLYYTLVVKEPFVSQMFSSEILSQNYKRIIQDFDLFPLYKKAIQTVPSASRQNALWGAVTSILGTTVKEVWSKDYAKQLFEEAKANPEVAALIENVKTKIGEKVDLAKLTELRDTIKYITGRAIAPADQALLELPMKAVEYVAQVTPDGQVVIPGAFTRKLHLRANSKVRVFMFYDE